MEDPSKVRMTRQRKEILEILRATDTHPTADEVYQEVRERLPRISLATVYRNLHFLEECGIIRSVSLGGTQRRFDGTLDDHYHVRCVGCGKVQDVSIEGVGPLDVRAESATDFDILGHRLEFIGLCPECRARKRLKTEKDPEHVRPRES